MSWREISTKPTFEGQSRVEPRMSHAPKIQQRGTEAAGRRHLWCQGLQDHHGSLQDQHNCTQHLFFTVRLFFMDSSVSSVLFFVLCFFVFLFFFDWVVTVVLHFLQKTFKFFKCRNLGKTKTLVETVFFHTFRLSAGQPRRCCRAMSRKLRWVHDVPRCPTPSQHLRPSRGRRLRRPWAPASSFSNQTKSFVKTQTQTKKL